MSRARRRQCCEATLRRRRTRGSLSAKSAFANPTENQIDTFKGELPTETALLLQSRKKKDKKKEKKEKRQKKDKRHKKEYSDEEGQIHDGGRTMPHVQLNTSCPPVPEVNSACSKEILYFARGAIMQRCVLAHAWVSVGLQVVRPGYFL